jgi:hypothetical protein
MGLTSGASARSLISHVLPVRGDPKIQTSFSSSASNESISSLDCSIRHSGFGRRCSQIREVRPQPDIQLRAKRRDLADIVRKRRCQFRVKPRRERRFVTQWHHSRSHAEPQLTRHRREGLQPEETRVRCICVSGSSTQRSCRRTGTRSRHLLRPNGGPRSGAASGAPEEWRRLGAPEGPAEPPRRFAALRADANEVGRLCGPGERAFRLSRQRPLLNRFLIVRSPGSAAAHGCDRLNTNVLMTKPSAAGCRFKLHSRSSEKPSSPIFALRSPSVMPHCQTPVMSR